MNDLISNLRACTNSNNYKIRAAAYTALGNFDTNEVIEELNKGLNDLNFEARSAALDSIKKIYNSRKEIEFFEAWLCEIDALRIS